MKSSIGIAALLIIFLSACEFLPYDQEISTIVKSGNPEDCKSLTGDDDSATRERIETCYDRYAKAHDQPELCANIQKESRHDDCLQTIALEREDTMLCEQLKGNTDTCISKIGIAKNDETICEDLPSGSAKDNCNREIAISKKSVELCERVESSMHKDNCMIPIALEKKDITLCDKVSRYSKERCISQLATKEKDETLCEHSSKKEECKKQVQTAIAQEVKTSGITEIDGRLYINSPPGEELRITSADIPEWADALMVTVGAQASCVGPPSTITTGDPHVLLNGKPVARLNDDTSHGGKIAEGSSHIFINGVPAAFIGANTVCPMVTGTVPHVGGPILTNK